MQQEDINYLKRKIENEGFDYAFRYYSSFDEIKDDKFNKLREEYIIASKRLGSYIDDPETFIMLEAASQSTDEQPVEQKENEALSRFHLYT